MKVLLAVEVPRGKSAQMCPRRRLDVVEVMERAYSLADSDERWFANLAGALDFWGDSLDSRWAGGFFEVDTRGRVSITSEWNDGVQLPVSLVETAERMHPADRSATFLGPLGLSSFDEVVVK